MSLWTSRLKPRKNSRFLGRTLEAWLYIFLPPLESCSSEQKLDHSKEDFGFCSRNLRSYYARPDHTASFSAPPFSLEKQTILIPLVSKPFFPTPFPLPKKSLRFIEMQTPVRPTIGACKSAILWLERPGGLDFTVQSDLHNQTRRVVLTRGGDD